MALLLDAYNVIHADPGLRDALRRRGPQAARAELIGLLTRWRAARADLPEVVVVFDGAPPVSAGPRVAGLRVRFADRDADGDLARLLERSGDHALVSADGELCARAAQLGQRVVAPGAFLDEVALDLEAAGEVRLRDPGRLGPGEVAAWLEWFGGAPTSGPTPAPAGSAAPPPGDALSPEEVRRWLEAFGAEPGE